MAIKDEVTVRHAFEAAIREIALFSQGDISDKVCLYRLIALIDNEELAAAIGDDEQE